MNRTLIPILLVVGILVSGPVHSASEPRSDDIQIIAGKDRTIYEYRSNGILLMIKIVPKKGKGKPYYMVPADGSPHYDGLDQHKKLYPQWIILEW